jgi:hypothetical protein
VGDGADEHRRQRRPVPLGRVGAGLGGEPLADDPLDALDLVLAHLRQQVGEAGQVADQQPVEVAFLVESLQAGAREGGQALARRQVGEGGLVAGEASSCWPAAICWRTPSASRACLDRKWRYRLPEPGDRPAACSMSATVVAA